MTDEALIAETMVWPNFFLMNVFFALKGSKLFIIISIPSLGTTHGVAMKTTSLCTSKIQRQKQKKILEHADLMLNRCDVYFYFDFEQS